MLTRISLFRPANVVKRLVPRSEACPLSGSELLRCATELGLVLPIVQAPDVGVACGALVAAKELNAALGLGVPPATETAAWFEGVARAADELAAGLPLFLSADVIVEGEGAIQIERSRKDAWRLLDAGFTHLAVDVADVSAPEHGRVVGEVGRAAAEHGLSVEVLVPLGNGEEMAARGASTFQELARIDEAAFVAGIRCPAPGGDGEARRQIATLSRLCGTFGDVPVVRRGPVTSRLLELMRGSRISACEDGGAAARRALALVPSESALPRESSRRSGQRENRFERSAAEAAGEVEERLEAHAYVEAMDFIERLGAGGSAPALAAALEKRLERS